MLWQDPLQERLIAYDVSNVDLVQLSFALRIPLNNNSLQN